MPKQPKQSHPIIPEVLLSSQQLAAVDLVAIGRNDTQVAEELGLARETVTRWRLYNPHFQAQLNKRRKELWESSRDKVTGLVDKALGVLEKALDDGDLNQKLKAAELALKAAGVYGNIYKSPDNLPTDPELILKNRASEWASVEIKKKPHSGQLFNDVYSDTMLQANLQNERMKQLLPLLESAPEEFAVVLSKDSNESL